MKHWGGHQHCNSALPPSEGDRGRGWSRSLFLVLSSYFLTFYFKSLNETFCPRLFAERSAVLDAAVLWCCWNGRHQIDHKVESTTTQQNRRSNPSNPNEGRIYCGTVIIDRISFWSIQYHKFQWSWKLMACRWQYSPSIFEKTHRAHFFLSHVW